MRHRTRDDIRIQKLLHAAKTIAVIGGDARLFGRTTTVANFLKRDGYDVVLIARDGWREHLRQMRGPVDVVLVFGPIEEDVIDAAAAKKAEAVWLATGGFDARRTTRARAAGIALISNRDIVADLRTRRRESGEPHKFGIVPAARSFTAQPRGYVEAGGGGRHGGGGGRAAMDEKKMQPGGATSRRRRSRRVA